MFNLPADLVPHALTLAGLLIALAACGLVRLFDCRAWRKGTVLFFGLFFGIMVPVLGWWEVTRDQPLILSGGDAVPRFAVHVFLLAVMTLVARIDFEHYTIPDALMIPATVTAVALMTLFPGAAMPDYDVDPSSGIIFPRVMTAFPSVLKDSTRMMICFGAVFFWAFALLDRRWYPRLGLKRCAALFCRRIRQSFLTWILLVLALLAALLVWGLYRTPAETHEAQKVALLSALTGMTASMILIWGVRLIGGAVLGREAMGFGDVVLMGFLGAVFGWQGGLVLFFLAPLAGVVFGLIRMAGRWPREIPYGPFLSLAALAVIFGWEAILPRIHDFLIGPLVAAILMAMGVLMALLLWVIQIVKRCFR